MWVGQGACSAMLPGFATAEMGMAVPISRRFLGTVRCCCRVCRTSAWPGVLGCATSPWGRRRAAATGMRLAWLRPCAVRAWPCRVCIYPLWTRAASVCRRVAKRLRCRRTEAGSASVRNSLAERFITCALGCGGVCQPMSHPWLRGRVGFPSLPSRQWASLPSAVCHHGVLCPIPAPTPIPDRSRHRRRHQATAATAAVPCASMMSTTTNWRAICMRWRSGACAIPRRSRMADPATAMDGRRWRTRPAYPR